MRIVDTTEIDTFREKVRDWLNANVPHERRPLEGSEMRDFDKAWQRAQYDGGWAGISWPADYGGCGLSLLQQIVWYEEYTFAGAPPIASMFVALSHAGPTLIVQGSEAQKSFHLPRILKGESQWCQGFSEPNAGSDLGSLSTRAEIDGDELVVNGSKTWTTYGHVADFQELLVRTDPSAHKHGGISWVICDMKSPGITVRPIKAMSGLTHFCQVFYDDVRIPLGNVVGELHGGWKVAMTTLGFERGTGTLSHQIELSATVDRLVDIARNTDAAEGGHKLIHDEAVASRLARLKADVAALRSMTALTISRGLREAVPGAEGNIVALFFGELSRRVYGAAIELLGAEGLERAEHDWPREYLEAFKWAIGGGTSDIRRNAIGERVLGLPKMRSV